MFRVILSPSRNDLGRQVVGDISVENSPIYM